MATTKIDDILSKKEEDADIIELVATNTTKGPVTESNGERKPKKRSLEIESNGERKPTKKTPHTPLSKGHAAESCTPRAIDVKYFFESITEAVNDFKKKNSDVIRCPHCEANLNWALNFEDLDDITFSEDDERFIKRPFACLSCTKRIDVRETYLNMAEAFKSLAEEYVEKARDFEQHTV